jgi:hypothetical protein
MVKAKEAQWVLKAAGFLWLEARAKLLSLHGAQDITKVMGYL